MNEMYFHCNGSNTRRGTFLANLYFLWSCPVHSTLTSTQVSSREWMSCSSMQWICMMRGIESEKVLPRLVQTTILTLMSPTQFFTNFPRYFYPQTGPLSSAHFITPVFRPAHRFERQKMLTGTPKKEKGFESGTAGGP